MANSLYAKGREAFLEGTIAALTDTLKLSLLSTAYTPNLSTDQFYSIVSGGAIVAAGVALSGRSGLAGTLSASNVVFPAVTGSTASYLALYKDTGSAATSPLIGLIDTAAGLPITPNGGDITVAWSNGQIFTLFASLAERAGDKAAASRWRRLIDAVRGAWRPSEGGIWMPEPQVSYGR